MTKLVYLNDSDSEKLEELRNTSAFTIEGAGGDLNDWMKGINELLAEKNIGQVDTFYTFSGKLMNDTYNLTGSNRYPDDFTFLCFKLDGLDIGKLAMFKLQFGARWLDDIIDNNLVREQRVMEV